MTAIEKPVGPKKTLEQVIEDIVTKFGTQITRGDLYGYLNTHNVSIPHVLREHKIGRGFYNLEPLYNKVKGQNAYKAASPVAEPTPDMTDDEIEQDILARFAGLDLMTYGVVDGDFHSLIVSGNPGTGKTYTLESILQAAADTTKILYTQVRGYVKATGLFRLMWEHRDKEAVLHMDDADSIFQDETALNLLKAGLDTTKRRRISWRSEKDFEDDGGEQIPKEFDFHGSIVFVSNLDFQRLISQQNKLAPHLSALMSRSFYLDLNLNSQRELIIRIKGVVKNTAILSEMDIKKKEQEHIMEFLENNQDYFRELSLRTVVKMGVIMRASKGDAKKFSHMATATLLSRSRR